MKIKSEKTLELFRHEGPCEKCGKWCERRQPHHYWIKRGYGGGHRLDHPLNLVGICWECHAKAESGEIKKEIFLLIVSQRENIPCAEIDRFLWALCRRSKYAKPTAGSRDGDLDTQDRPAAKGGEQGDGIYGKVPRAGPRSGSAPGPTSDEIEF